MAQYLIVNRSKLYVCPIPSEISKTKIKDESLDNLIRDDNYNGFISARTCKKIKLICEAMATSIESIRKENKKFAFKNKIQLTFATLTLPYKQFHKDNVIKRKCLSPMIDWLKDECNICFYIWRAEPQENGNIHFHLLLDRFVDWRALREKWNQLLNRLEYIDAFEQKHGHRDPNSTDIHSLRKIDNIAAYLVKYMTKKEVRRKIDGRLWGCCKEFHKVKAPKVYFTDYLRELVRQFTASKCIFIKVFDYVESFFIRSGDLCRMYLEEISDIWLDFCNNLITKKILDYGTKF